MKKVSFCITCMNRFHQITQTLPVNLSDNLPDKTDIEFILVDFGSKDGLKEWVLSNYKEELHSGYLQYLYTESLVTWHASIAKNTAHYFSNGEVVVNLDCDNYTGRRGGAFVMEQFDKFGNTLLLHQFSGVFRDGSCGRIGMRKEFFLKIGGYDESFLPMGYQDLDILKRLHMFVMNYESVKDSRYNNAIRNSKKDSLKNTASGMSYRKMNMHNFFLSKGNAEAGKIICSRGKMGVGEGIFRFDKNTFIPV
jgi:predicted glycosyltransferase involved in capsule biosynthesis